MKTMSKKANGGTVGKPKGGSTDAKAKPFAPKMGHRSSKSAQKGTMSKAKTFG